jgi:hypothetical protein
MDKHPIRWIVPTLLLLGLSAAAASDPLPASNWIGVGDTIPTFTLDDQHGVTREVGHSVRAIVFSRDMDGGDFIKQTLKDKDGAYLADRELVYVADISGMPALVTRMFALPSMRRRSYPLLLDRDGTRTAELPDVAGEATLIRLDALRVTGIQHFDSAEKLAEALAKLPVD